ncbi:MAG: hypothetical protein WCZ89_04005 [Phycisphaerae bacterium]
MQTALNGKNLFGKDGGLDVARLYRRIKQNGTLSAKSIGQLDEKLNSIKDYMDGYPYTLTAADGRRFENVCIDSLKFKNRRAVNRGWLVDYEICYMQMIG